MNFHSIISLSSRVVVNILACKDLTGDEIPRNGIDAFSSWKYSAYKIGKTNSNTGYLHGHPQPLVQFPDLIIEEVEVRVSEEELCSVATDVIKGGIQSFYKVLVGESQNGLLDPRSKAMHSSTNSNLPFEKQPLA